MSIPLRYEISDWHQLKDVVSNNSRDLYITVTDFVQSDILSGMRIKVNHKSYGVLFSEVINGSGTLLSESSEGVIYELTPPTILKELEKFGFYVTFEVQKHLSDDQLVYLSTLKYFHYDKLRILSVWTIEHGVKQHTWYIVAFNIDKNPTWINYNYDAPDSEYVEALRNGSAINITEISNIQKWDWSWLDFVADIDDILSENL